jgi:hypothetical protein
VLSQEFDGVRQHIAYASRTLSAQERKASVYELECLAVLFGKEKFRKYIEHQEFILETDNVALFWLLSLPRQLEKTGRWATNISALKFQVRHIRGTQNIVDDTLSRMFDSSPAEESTLASCNLTLTNFPLAFHDFKQLQLQNPELVDIRNRLGQGGRIDHHHLSKGLLYWHFRKGRSQKLVVPESARPMIFAYFHDSSLSGHLGVFKTLSKIREHFMWKGMDKEVRDKVRQCHTCSLSKPTQNTRFGLLSSDVAQRLLQKLCIDLVGKFPRSKAGNTSILVSVDAFSKFVWMIAVRESSTRATIKALEERIFPIFSVPEILVSNNTQCFASREFWHFCF